MRKLLLFVLVGILCTFMSKSQIPDTVKMYTDSLQSGEQVQHDTVSIDTAGRKIMGDKPQIEKEGDTTKIRLGTKGITIIEKNGKTTVNINDVNSKSTEAEDSTEAENDFKYDHDRFKNRHSFNFNRYESNHFNPHFAGFELGFNNFLNSKSQIGPASKDSFMTLSTGKSVVVNINIIEYGFGFGSHNGIVTGLGFECNSFRFDNNNTITKLNGRIVPKYAPANTVWDKGKLTVYYLNVPLLYEIQFPIGNRNKPLYFSFGVIGSLKIGSHAKEVYYDNGDRRKDVERGDFYLTPLRYGFQARAGYRMLNLFANYYPTPLFDKQKAPELYAFDIGLVLLNF